MGTQENYQSTIDSVYTSAYDALHDALVNTDAVGKGDAFNLRA